MRSPALALVLGGLCASWLPAAPAAQEHGDAAVLSSSEVELALELSPLPEIPPDPTNAYYESESAARLGQALFYDRRFSGPGTIACATCHDPAASWGDGRKLAVAVHHNPRHTMTLWNVAYNRWFFWDGRADTLWSQALGPFEDPREHASSRLQVLHVLGSDPALVRAYEDVFGPFPDLSDPSRFPPEGRPVPGIPNHPHQVAWSSMNEADRALVTGSYVRLGKAIAAFERNIVSRAAPFDRFVEGLRTGSAEKLAAISAPARRGFALFVGKGKCHVCHDGPNFTDLEFHTNRVPTEEGVDRGRQTGIGLLRRSEFNTSSTHADDGGETGRHKLAFTRRHPDMLGEFKTPTLRNVARTAPYMHEGQMATLEEVIDFYSTLAGGVTLPPDAERILTPANFTDAEKADLLAFLESLTDESLPEELLAAPPTPYLPGGR